jgi:hypothetical protein
VVLDLSEHSLRHRNPDDLAKEIGNHIWTISRSAVRKYRLIILAIQLLVGGFCLTLVAILQ